MRRAWMVIALVLLPQVANAYAVVPKTGSFGKHLSQLRKAAVKHRMKSFARLTMSDFTVGEELDRASSLDVIRSEPKRWSELVRLIDHGRCYSTGRGLVQCELPDPGPLLDHTKFHGSSLLAIFEHTRRGWRLGLFSA